MYKNISVGCFCCSICQYNIPN